MANIVTREVGAAAKGSPLTNVEIDNNFINLNLYKKEKYTQVKNVSGASLPPGTVVYITGASGSIITATKASVSSGVVSSRALAVVVDTIQNNEIGRCIQDDIVENIDTSGFTEGAQLYLSTTTPGSITTTAPSSIRDLVFIGWCIKSDAILGSILVATNVTPNTVADISITHNASDVTVNSSEGSDGILNAATTSLAGVMSSADKTKLDGIAAGAEVNVNADWNAVNGDALILNKPTLGTAAAANTTDFATAAQGVKADTALQPAAIGVSVQAYDADLTSWAAISPSAKQDALISGTSIKTVNSTSLLGSGDIAVQPTLVSGTNIKTVNGNSLLGSGDLTISGGSSTLTIQNKTAAYTVVAGDNGTIINCTSGTFTVSLTAAATLGAGFNCWVWNTALGTTITIDPNASETLDGQSTLLLRSGEGTQIICDGANWQTGGKKTMRGYAESMDADSRASVAGLRALAIGYNANCASSYGTALGQNSYAQGSVTNAAGNGAMALGGSYASGTDSFAAAVANNSSSYGASADNAIALGYQAKASGVYSFAVGRQAQAQANSSFAFGYTALASAAGGFAFGEGAQANGVQGFAIGVGTRANGSRAIAIGGASGAQAIGDYSIAIGSVKAYESNKYAFGGASTAQYGVLPLWKDTTDATPTVLISYSAGSPGTTNQLILQNNSAYAFSGTIIARQKASAGSNYAAWEIKGAIIRDANAASTSLGSYNINVLSKTAGASAWTVALSADTTNGGLAITVTGAAGINIRWLATVQTSEVTYA